MKGRTIWGVAVAAAETPELAASGIHIAGLERFFDRPRRRPVDRAGHRILHVTVSGQGKGLVNGRWVTLPARAAYIVPPGAEWAWRYDAKTEACYGAATQQTCCGPSGSSTGNPWGQGARPS